MQRGSGRWWLLLIVGTVLFGLFFYYSVWTAPKLADANNCRIDRVVPDHTVVLIDQSDPFTKTDVEWTLNLVLDEARALEKNGRLSIFTIETETPGDVRPVFTRCSPGAEAHILYENPQVIKHDWEEKFANQLDVVLHDVMLQAKSPLSPLMEQISGITSRYDFASGRPKRRLILISDMMQNSSSYSFYRSGVSYPDFKSKHLPMPDLSDVDVSIFVASRSDGPSRNEKVNFWAQYFRDAHAKSFSVLR